MKLKKIAAALLSTAMLSLSLTGCGGPAASQTSDDGTLDPVTLKLYFVSEAPRDLDQVVEKLNEILQRDLNTTIEMEFTTWTDYTQKYDLALKSAGDVDLIYTANWMSYAQYCNQGAFLELEELLPEYAPKLLEMIDESVWNQVSVADHVYAVPSSRFVYGSKGIVYRTDLAEQYNLPVPDSVENVETYLDGVKAALPDQGLFGASVEQNASGEPFNAHSMLIGLKYKWVNDSYSTYGLAADYEDPSNLYDYWNSDDFVEDMKTLKRWADKGYWSKSVLSETADPSAFNVGKIALACGGTNPGKAASARNALRKNNPEWDSDFVSFSSISNLAYYATPTANMMSIPYSSKNPERALMVLEKLTTDPECYALLQYGIEGVHYTNDDGYYQAVLDADGTSGYEAGAFAWGMENPQLMLEEKNNEYFESIYADLDKIREQTPFDGANIYEGFNENIESYQAERAALGNVISQYLTPLEAGMVEDVDAAVAEFRQKAEEAGLSKIQDAYREQWKAYCEEYGYVK